MTLTTMTIDTNKTMMNYVYYLLILSVIMNFPTGKTNVKITFYENLKNMFFLCVGKGALYMYCTAIQYALEIF